MSPTRFVRSARPHLAVCSGFCWRFTASRNCSHPINALSPSQQQGALSKCHDLPETMTWNFLFHMTVKQEVISLIIKLRTWWERLSFHNISSSIRVKAGTFRSQSGKTGGASENITWCEIEIVWFGCFTIIFNAFQRLNGLKKVTLNSFHLKRKIHILFIYVSFSHQLLWNGRYCCCVSAPCCLWTGVLSFNRSKCVTCWGQGELTTSKAIL